MEISNVDFIKNEAGSQGGGILFSESLKISFYNSIVEENLS